MRKLFIILLSALSLTAVAQQTIALLEPRVGDGSSDVTGLERNMVRGELRKALVNLDGFDAITRADIDQMMKEQNFQRTGMVSAAQIKKLGEMSGADYICVSTLTKSNAEFYLEAYLIHLETGKMSNPASQYGELVNGKLANLFPACQALAKELVGDANKASSKESIRPAAYFVVENNVYSEGPIKRNDLLSSYGRIEVRDENNPQLKADYKVVSFKVQFDNGVTYTVEGDKFSEEVFERLRRCKQGHTCIISDIMAKNKISGEIAKLRGIVSYID